MFCRKQFGFREGHSTADALLEYVNEVYNGLNESKYFFTIFLDFSRAFDTVNLELLLKKIDHMGIRGVALSWLRTFLYGRQQYVSVDGVSSSTKPISIGVPQGSTLGPLLFILYINDLHLVASHCNVVHYADDTTIYCGDSDYSRAVLNINSDLLRIQDWLMCNRLSINVQKTNYMITTNKLIPNNNPVKFGDEVLSPVASARFLGVILDDKLTFSAHIRNVVSKMSRGLGIMRRLRCVLPPATLKSVFYSLVHCHIVYALTIWGNANKSVIDGVSRAMHSAVSLLCGDVRIVDPYCHFSILNFTKTVKYFNLIHFHKIVHGDDNSYFADKLRSCQIGHYHATRFQTDGKFLPPFYRKCRSQNAFLFKATNDWNELPAHLREVLSPIRFKTKLKKYLLGT